MKRKTAFFIQLNVKEKEGGNPMETRNAVLFTQLHAYRRELMDMIADVSEAEAEEIPAGFNNNIRWNLGHIIIDQYLWIRALTKEDMPVPTTFTAWFGYGTGPSAFTSDTPSFSELSLILQRQPAIIEERYGNRMQEEFAPINMGMHTIEQVMIRTIFHEGLHIGAIQAIKRQLANGGQMPSGRRHKA
ncbi:DinB family protein [Paenibacillus sp. D51F]